MPCCILTEKGESLEGWLKIGLKLKWTELTKETIGIDTPDDLKKAFDVF